jgi:uncharacterized damage-inducible protein DinB
MPLTFEFRHLLEYTDWDRAQWEAWFRGQGPAALAVGLGPNGDGRITNVGELVRHIFSAEQRYTERIRGVPLTDTSTVPPHDVEALFEFGRQSRRALRALVADLPPERWDEAKEMQIGRFKVAVSPRTMIVQAVTHEIRHWAQIAAFLRMDGRKPGTHDFLVSPVFAPDSATGAPRG